MKNRRQPSRPNRPQAKRQVHHTPKRNIKVMVPVKRVSDFAVRVRAGADGKGVDLNGVKMSANYFDLISLEEAVRLKEKGTATDVIAVTVGPKESQEVLRTALAMGATKAIHIDAPGRTDRDIQPRHVAKALSNLAQRDSVDLIITGQQATDDDYQLTGQMAAGYLNWTQATCVSKIDIADKIATVVKEVDGGLENVKLSLPSVVTADLKLNTPRYATLPNIMKARKAPIEVITLDSMGIDIQPQLDVLEVTNPPVRAAGKKVDSVDALVAELKSKSIV